LALARSEKGSAMGRGCVKTRKAIFA